MRRRLNAAAAYAAPSKQLKALVLMLRHVNPRVLALVHATQRISEPQR